MFKILRFTLSNRVLMIWIFFFSCWSFLDVVLDNPTWGSHVEKTNDYGIRFIRSHKTTKGVVTRCVFESPKCDKCLWRPGSARSRWMSLNAPPTPFSRNPTSWELGSYFYWEWEEEESHYICNNRPHLLTVCMRCVCFLISRQTAKFVQ